MNDAVETDLREMAVFCEITGGPLWKRRATAIREVLADNKRLRKEVPTADAEIWREAHNRVLADNKRLRAEEKQQRRLKHRANTKIAVALEEAEDTNAPDDYRKLQRVVWILKGKRRMEVSDAE